MYKYHMGGAEKNQSMCCPNLFIININGNVSLLDHPLAQLDTHDTSHFLWYWLC